MRPLKRQRRASNGNNNLSAFNSGPNTKNNTSNNQNPSSNNWNIPTFKYEWNTNITNDENTNQTNHSNTNLNTTSNENKSKPLNPNHDYVVPDTTNDQISCVEYHPSKEDIFSVGSWDNTITIYQHNNNQTTKLCQQTHDKPILCCTWHPNKNSLFSAGCDNIIKMWTPQQQQNSFINIGQHQSPIRCIKYCSELNCLISGSWDCNLSFWDIRNPTNINKVFNKSFNGNKIYAMTQKNNYLVIGLSNEDVQVLDLRNNNNIISSLLEEKKNATKPVILRAQVRSLDIFPDLF